VGNLTKKHRDNSKKFLGIKAVHTVKHTYRISQQGKPSLIGFGVSVKLFARAAPGFWAAGKSLASHAVRAGKPLNNIKKDVNSQCFTNCFPLDNGVKTMERTAHLFAALFQQSVITECRTQTYMPPQAGNKNFHGII